MKQAKMIVKQSQVFDTLNKAMDIVEPIFTTGKKITKREINKANQALESLNVTCWLSKGYISYLKLYAQDRSIQGDPDENGISSTYYVNDYEKSIMLDNETGGVSLEEYRKYKSNYKSINEAQAQKHIDQYNKLQTKIDALKDEQSKIPYRWMMR